MSILFLVLGFALLVAGGEALVRGAVALAGRLGMSPLLIGLTLVGFGTSTPELVTSLDAALSGLPGIAVGNVVGSNIANVLLILGIAAAIAPVAVARTTLLRDGLAMGGATLLGAAVILYGHLGRVPGLLLLLALAAYLVVAYRTGRADEADVPDASGLSVPVALLLTVGGIGVTVLGARFAVDAAVEIADALGVSKTVIGLTVVAVGTSLPELVTSAVAAVRRQGDVALGNVLGSNIYNIGGILGITALVEPIDVPAQIAALDVWVMLAATALLLALGVTGRVGRAAGVLLVALYAAYLATLALMATG